MDARTDSRPAADVVRATGVVAVGMMAMNVFAYGFTLIAAHLLGPGAFGAVSALLGLLIVSTVGALAVQATAARRLATAAPHDHAGIERDVVLVAVLLALVLGAALTAAAPLIDDVLHLQDRVAAALVGAASVPLTVMGAYAGICQGLRRWRALAAVYAAMGAGRLVAGAGALLVEPSLRAALVGVTAGSFAAPVLGAVLCPLPARSLRRHHPVLRELWRNGSTLLAFFVFTNVDVLVARHLFVAHEAGIYAAGAILAKACLFLPAFVLVAAFPDMATSRRARPWLPALLAVLGLGAVAVVAAYALPELAVTFAGGREYADLAGVAWLFAAEGTLFAALQILVYGTIAGQAHFAVVLWLGTAAAIAVAITVVDSATSLVLLMTALTAGLALVTSLMPGATHPD